MDLENKMDFLAENTQGKVYEYIQDLINAYYSLKNDLEDEREAYENLKEYSKPLTHEEIEGVSAYGPI
nr:MAG TPA: hypothetical protein [Caudoviricetes sp.]